MNRVEYDKTGALTKLFAPQGSTYFQYAATGLVTELATPDKTFQFSYDGNLQRRAIVEDGAATYYIWDGLRLLETRNADHSLKAKFTHGVARIEGIGSCVEVYRASDGKRFYLPQDQRGTVGVVLDEARSVVASQSCSAFGEVIAATGTWPDEVPFRYQSNWLYLCDLPDGAPLYLSSARIMAARVGRFMQRDWLRRRRIGGRVYAYARSAASLRVDPSGFCSMDCDAMMLYDYQHRPGETVEEFAARLRDEQRRLAEHVRQMRRSHPIRRPPPLDEAGLRTRVAQNARKAGMSDAEAECCAEKLSEAYGKMIRENMSWPESCVEIRRGHLCYTWANLTYSALRPLFRPGGACEKLQMWRVGTTDQKNPSETEHNYVFVVGLGSGTNPIVLDPWSRGPSWWDQQSEYSQKVTVHGPDGSNDGARAPAKCACTASTRNW